MQLSKPSWLKIKLETTDSFLGIKETLQKHNLNTVCEEARCPNISECWNGGTATFMVMGDTCTRACKFCAVKTAFPAPPLDKNEPKKLAAAIKEIGLFDYVVLTSVDRDDLKDQGASHFAECIAEIKKAHPGIIVEVLTPDFRGEKPCVETIIKARPEVFAHNVETVRRLQRPIRDPRAGYDQSLSILRHAKSLNPQVFTKSSLMLGLGEKEEEVIQTMQDLRKIDVDIFTLGQYLRPSDWHTPIKEYVSPEQFEYYKRKGEELGFKFVASGPFVRSSYKAGELFVKNILRKSL